VSAENYWYSLMFADLQRSNRVSNVRLDQGRQLFFIKRAILLHLPADMNDEVPQNVDTVLFFVRFHRGYAKLQTT